MEEIGLVSCSRSVAILVAAIVVLTMPKLVALNTLVVDTANVDVQFMYCC